MTECRETEIIITSRRPLKKKECVVDELWPEEELQVKELEQRQTLLITFVAHIPQITLTNWCEPLILSIARIRAVFSF